MTTGLYIVLRMALLEVPRIFRDRRKSTSAIVIPITPLSARIRLSDILNLFITELSVNIRHVIINRIVPIVFLSGLSTYGDIVFPIILNRETDIPHVIALPSDSISPIGILVW
tara:strand:+ start:522 stop:860 length:339 start_codon:yes stop_codon:yes gene_type:complete